MHIRRVEGERRRVQAQVAQAAVLRPERQPADGRMDPVGAHEQIGIQDGAVLQRHRHAAGAVGEVDQRGVIAQLDLGRKVLGQHGLHVGTQQVQQKHSYGKRQGYYGMRMGSRAQYAVAPPFCIFCALQGEDLFGNPSG
ncbi:hypothetical protein [Nonomuraea mesophila]|uniref:hypothetical protein n=1 Tax=Nonomuraea mesophila TaxID=2530382 RepID=UPI001407F6B2|nr:hypothetical protein [Nonomuraea mesophila]